MDRHEPKLHFRVKKRKKKSREITASPQYFLFSPDFWPVFSLGEENKIHKKFLLPAAFKLPWLPSPAPPLATQSLNISFFVERSTDFWSSPINCGQWWSRDGHQVPPGGLGGENTSFPSGNFWTIETFSTLWWFPSFWATRQRVAGWTLIKIILRSTYLHNQRIVQRKWWPNGNWIAAGTAGTVTQRVTSQVGRSHYSSEWNIRKQTQWPTFFF